MTKLQKRQNKSLPSPKSTIIHEEFSGPIPPPQALEKYEQVCPGAADRIIKMAESQAEHRQKIERTAANSESYSRQAGLIFAFVLALTGIILAGYLAIQGQIIGVGIIGAVGLVPLVSKFIYRPKA